MENKLPSRPHLDHLRRQAKSLLSALAAGDLAAAATLIEFLPSVKGMTPDRVRAAGLRLADGQSAVARQTGFASWPQLSRHVEQLRALEGTWEFARLEIEGSEIPAAGLSASRLLIDGDRFRMESPEANYEGVFNIDVEAVPHRIEIEFVEGPEAGNWNYGIFRLTGDQLEICLDVNGRPSPKEFRTAAGSGHAYETLRRVSGARPEAVKGGTGKRVEKKGSGESAGAPVSAQGFEYVATPMSSRLQGEWAAVKVVRDGMELPEMMLKMGRRSAKGNEIKIIFGGQVMIHALVRINEKAKPVEVDYFNLAGPVKGSTQMGIMEWRGDVVCFCMAGAGQERPADFECEKGSGRTLSHWRKT